MPRSPHLRLRHIRNEDRLKLRIAQIAFKNMRGFRIVLEKEYRCTMEIWGGKRLCFRRLNRLANVDRGNGDVRAIQVSWLRSSECCGTTFEVFLPVGGLPGKMPCAAKPERRAATRRLSSHRSSGIEPELSPAHFRVTSPAERANVAGIPASQAP